MPRTNSERSISSSFAKGLAILEAFDANTRELTLAELARRTGQDRATARRGALTLVAAGYLRQNDRKLSLSPRVLALSGAFLTAHQWGTLIQPILNHYAGLLQSDLTLVMLDQFSPLALAHSPYSHKRGRSDFVPGLRLPLLHTSFGRMLLALHPDDAVKSHLETLEITPEAQRALTEMDDILEQIKQAQQQGYSFVDGESKQGILGCAVPVSTPGRTPLVVGTTYPRGLGAEAPDDVILTHLQACAAELRQVPICQSL